jgi:hypothetical protein
MYLPPEERKSGQPPRPRSGPPRRREAVLLWLSGAFLVSVLLGPIGGGTLIQALLAVLPHP